MRYNDAIMDDSLATIETLLQRIAVLKQSRSCNMKIACYENNSHSSNGPTPDKPLPFDDVKAKKFPKTRETTRTTKRTSGSKPFRAPTRRSRNRTTIGRLSPMRQLIGCLYDLAVEPTNNRAERALRPVVIACKISCGNKTDRGRQTWQVLASLAATCMQRGENLIDYITTHPLGTAKQE